MRVLVVDDNMDTAESMALLVRGLGHEVNFAVSGRVALQVARSFRPNVVFLDLGLPDIDGCELASRLRVEAESPRTRIIAVTGSGRLDDRERALQSGCDDYVLKPLDAKFLTSLLGNRLV
jgi:CheY-like chemotaxis protein